MATASLQISQSVCKHGHEADQRPSRSRDTHTNRCARFRPPLPSVSPHYGLVCAVCFLDPKYLLDAGARSEAMVGQQGSERVAVAAKLPQALLDQLSQVCCEFLPTATQLHRDCRMPM